MPRSTAIDTLVAAAERQRAVLNEIALLRILPVAESALRFETEHSRSPSIQGGRICEFAAAEQFWRIRAFRHLHGRRKEAVHVIVDVRRQALAGFKNQDPLVGLAQPFGDQNTGNTGAYNQGIESIHSFRAHITPPSP
jgi:hypothetical protein